MIKRMKKISYSYSLLDKMKILSSNIFWKVADILSCRFTKLAYIYDRLIVKSYENEIGQFDISKSKKILHIGCGSYPITAIVLSRMSNGEIIGIDKSKNSIKRAERYISKKNIGIRVSVQHGDGSKFPLEGFDTIIISSCSIPKYIILEHLFNDAPSKSKIIVRERSKQVKPILQHINSYSEDIEFFRKIDNKSSPMFQWDSYCVIKK